MTYYGYEIEEEQVLTTDPVTFSIYLDGWVYNADTIQEAKRQVREWIGLQD